MDSGNSASLQSSSGDEEYDSRADSISALMTNPGPQPPAAAPLNTSNNSSILDPLSNYFDTISRPLPQQEALQTPNSLLNLDMSWSKTVRSDLNSTEIINPMMVSASSIQSLFGSNQVHGKGSFSTSSQLQSQSPAVSATPENNTSAATTPRPTAAAPGDQNNPTNVVRPKKRSRASRRAPTTVLTTDTTNFRAMVQEFTGIPAPPFTSSSPFPRSRLDLYGTHSGLRSNPLDSPQPPYLRRPFPQKVQLPPPLPPFLASSSASSLLVDHAAIASPNSTNNITSGLNINNSSPSTASLGYQLPPQGANLFTMPNPLLASFLQSNGAKYSPANPSIIGSKAPQAHGSLDIPSNNDSQLKVGVLDEFGLSSHGHVNTSSLSGLPGLISSDQTSSSRNDNSLVNWGSGVGSKDSDQHPGHQVSRPSGNGNNFNFSFSRIIDANGKLNYSGSSSSFHGDKGPDNVAPTTRGEGMMESWICSSD